ncbi:MAG: hypothetical protein NTV46_10180, partial [Verrucomicrobia bacterium]|nr:hypothetical protein [Verrucomicrobiota bacterium]
MKDLMLTLGTLVITMAHAMAAPSMLSQVQAEMRARQYDKAVVLAGQAVAANDDGADQACFLKATALFHGKKFPEAVAAAEQLLAGFPHSDWRHKAVFLKAQALIEQKKFAAAAAIFAAESARILAPVRKHALVGEILRFAGKLATKPDPNVPDAPQADFQKAYNLYTKALAMELPREFRDDIVFRKARAIQQAGNAAQAIQDFQAYLTEYDPVWTGPAGSGTARLPMQNPPPAGKHVAMARFRLAEAFHQSSNAAAARMELEDLLKMISAPNLTLTTLTAELATAEGKKLPAEIRWLKVQTYFTQAPIVARNSNIAVPNQAAQG